jgi:hypothetical protein
MIPKKIHYCWLSGEEFPAVIKECIKSWQEIMPDYEIILWDKSRFDVNSVAFVKEACEAKKWAFAADYIRLYALYNEGGIYLDSDVLVGKKFDVFLNYDFFTSLECTKKLNGRKKVSRTFDELSEKELKIESNSYGFQIAIMGAKIKNEFIKDCMNWYENHHFLLPDGTFRDNFSIGIGPDICSSVAQKYGFMYDTLKIQYFGENMVIFPAQYFPNGGGAATKDSYAVHYCKAGWVPKLSLYFIYRVFANNIFLRKLFGKKNLSFDSIKKLITS